MKSKELQNKFYLSLFPLDEDIKIDFNEKYLFNNNCDEDEDEIKHTIKHIFIDCLENKIKTICIYLNTPNVKSEDEQIKLESFVNTVLLFMHKYRLIYNVNVKLLKTTN